MSNRGKSALSLSAARSWGVLIVTGLAMAGSASAVAQEKSFSERVKDYWERVVCLTSIRIAVRRSLFFPDASAGCYSAAAGAERPFLACSTR
jgi:hypothetical protein